MERTEQTTGDFITYRLDWDKRRMEVTDCSPTLPVRGAQTSTISPIVYALEAFISRLGATIPARFLMDVRYDHDTITLSLHCTEDFASVVDVPTEQVTALLRRILSPRETEIATLLFESRTIRYITSKLQIAEGTTKRNIYNIYQKLNVASQVELVREIYARLAQQAGTACGGAQCFAPVSQSPSASGAEPLG